MAGKPPGPRKTGPAGENDDTGWHDTAMLLARISGIGWFVVGSIGAGVGVGWWLDRQFGTEPVLLLAGLLLGVIGAFAGMIRMLSAFGKQRTRR